MARRAAFLAPFSVMVARGNAGGHFDVGPEGFVVVVIPFDGDGYDG